MIIGLAFAFWRWFQILTLIPTLGMLAYFVHGFVASNVLTPDFILVLFITSVLATVWAMGTLLAYHRARHSAIFVSFVDLCLMASFIAGVVELRGAAQANCGHTTADDSFYASLGPFGTWGRSWGSPYAADLPKNCSILKACFAFGIMNLLFFLITAILALFIHRRNRKELVRTETREHAHVRRHDHRRSHSRSSRHSHRSHRSPRRQFDV
ncbi:MAG: hypothetical protein M1826_000094 [Phylliscum demangeonii]|nr:MAG: hypothetical protein M1826_000094 [Phylliscum demangeonii]